MQRSAILPQPANLPTRIDAKDGVGNGLSGATSHPFTWSNTFGLNDINTLIPANSGWTVWFPNFGLELLATFCAIIL